MTEPRKNNGENWLPHYLSAAGLNMNQLAKAAETNRQRIAALMARTTALPKHWADRLAPFLGTTSVKLVHGPDTPEGTDAVAPPSGVVQARVAGRVAAGLWFEESYIDGTIYEPVPIVLARFATTEQIAYLVTGPSMDRLKIFDGDYVITIPYWEARTSFRDNDVVVVERREGQKFERTCKQLVVFSDRIELWPRSTSDLFQTPIVVPIDRSVATDGLEIEVVGLVIGKHTVM